MCGGRPWLDGCPGRRRRCAGSYTLPDIGSGLCSRIGRSFWKLLVAWRLEGASTAWLLVRCSSSAREQQGAWGGQFLWEVGLGRVHTCLQCGPPHCIWDRVAAASQLVFGCRQCVGMDLVSPNAPPPLCGFCGTPGRK